MRKWLDQTTGPWQCNDCRTHPLSQLLSSGTEVNLKKKIHAIIYLSKWKHQKSSPIRVDPTLQRCSCAYQTHEKNCLQSYILEILGFSLSMTCTDLSTLYLPLNGKKLKIKKMEKQQKFGSRGIRMKEVKSDIHVLSWFSQSDFSYSPPHKRLPSDMNQA